MNLRTGQRLHCQVCSASVVVVRAGHDPVDLQCDGQPLAGEPPSLSGGAAPPNGSGSVMGKRYTDAPEALELLCVRGGAGTLAVAGEPLQVKASKPLPASD